MAGSWWYEDRRNGGEAVRVYLAGPINGCTDDEATGWREQAKRLLVGCECVDPMRRDYRGREAENAEAIVLADLADIRSCGAVVVMAERPTWGTAMEVFAAAADRKRVVAVCSGSVSPWLAYHAEVFPTLERACAAVRP